MAKRRTSNEGTTAGVSNNQPTTANDANLGSQDVVGDVLKSFATRSGELQTKFEQEIENLKSKYNEELESLKISNNEALNEIEKSKTETKELLQVNKKLQDEIKENSGKNIEILAIFVALFTFASANIQLYNSAQNIRQVLIITIVFGMLLLLFIGSFFLFSRKLFEYQKDGETKINNWIVTAFIITYAAMISSLIFLAYQPVFESISTIPRCSRLDINANDKACYITLEEIKQITERK